MAGTAGTPGTPRVLRAMNDRAALDLLLEHGPLSRTRIGKLTGLSKPTASQLLARLEAAGLVRLTGTSEGRPGPNAQLYAIDPTAAYAAGLDVTPAPHPGGGRRHHRPHRRRVRDCPPPAGVRRGPWSSRSPTPSTGPSRPPDWPAPSVHRLVIGTPGAFDPNTGRLRYASHLPGWHSPRCSTSSRRPTDAGRVRERRQPRRRRRAAARRGPRPRGLRAAVERGGLGAALVLGGRLHRGWTGGAGEVGFLPVPGAPLVRQVTKANSGGYQELAGSQALPELARELGVEDVPSGPYTEAATALVARAADHASGPHRELLQTYATRLATGLASLVSVLDPELVVLSGSALTAGGEVLRGLVQAELEELAASGPGWSSATSGSTPSCAARWSPRSPPPATRSSTPRAERPLFFPTPSPWETSPCPQPCPESPEKRLLP